MTLDAPAPLARLAAGDSAAMRAFHAEHAPALRRFVRTRLGDAAAVDDVVQEVFLAAWQSAGAFRGEGDPRSWLFTIARRTATRHDRRAQPAPTETETLAQLAEAAGFGSADPERLVARAQQQAALDRALERLSAADREIIALRDRAGLTGPQAAEALGITLHTAKIRLHRARLRLMAALREELPDG